MNQLALAIAALLFLTACQATADVVVRSAEDSAVLPAESPPLTPEAGSTEESVTLDSFEVAEGEARFTLQGELPLTDAEVNELMAFIEDDTGRPFLRPPVIVAQTTEEFIAALSEDIVDVETDSDISIRSLQALGLTDQGVAEATEAFLDLLLSPDGIQGYYDREVDKLFVPTDAIAGDEFRSLLVHELTHALDGQYVGYELYEGLSDEADETGNYEQFLASQAVAEGRATSVQNRWQRANGVLPAEASDPAGLDNVPPALVLSLGLPYVFGEQYIESNGGAANTWDLLETPPPTSEEFLVFGGIPPGERVIDVAAPPADGPVLDEVVFGAADIFVWLLGESLEPAEELVFPAFSAIDGWAGGKAVLWGDDVESCMRIAIAADSDQDLEEIRTAINTWVQAGPNRSLETNGDLVVVTGCAVYIP